MSRNNTKQKFIAMAQSAIIIVGMMPVSAIAQTLDEPSLPNAPDTTLYSNVELVDKPGQDSDEPEIGKEDQEPGGKIIIAFTELEESVAQQSADLDAPLSELNLPDTLSATVDGEIVAVPVTWACTPEYQNEAGKYIFTAVLGEGYILAEGVKAPGITAILKETTPLPNEPMELMGEGSSVMVTIAQDQTVADIASEIQTALSSADNATVIVSGLKTDVGSTLSLNISEGKTVVWKAVFKGGTSDYLIRLTGKGAFEVAESGEIDALTGGAIIGVSGYPDPNGPSITVSGGGVKAVEGCAIYINSNIIESIAVIVSGGIVSNAGTEENPAINVMVTPYGNGKADVVIKGEGKVSSTGIDGIAIRSFGNVLIQDTCEVSADGTAVSGKSITVDSGRISANKIAVRAEQGLLVNGGAISANDFAILASGRSHTTKIQSGRVEATDADGYAIYAAGNVLVSGGTVTAAGGNGAAIGSIASGSVVVDGGMISTDKTAILTVAGSVRVCGGTVRGGNNVIDSIIGGSVTVEGGTVSANGENGTAIKAMGSRSYVTIENGTVEAIGIGGNAISAQYSGGMLVCGGTVKASNIAIDFSGRKSTVTISGGTIHAVNTAIHILGDQDSNIAVSGGTISGGDNAIRLIAYMNPAITITGGTVLGCGSKHVIGDNNAAIYMESGVPTVTSPGAVIAWNKSAGNKLYGLNTTTDLASLPVSTAKWSRIDDKSGISYGTDGFLEMDGISVAEITAYATGLNELKVGKDVNAAITYTLTGGFYASDMDVLGFAPNELPDWLNITDTVIKNSTTVRLSLSGTPTGVGSSTPLSLPTEISATNLTGGSAGVPIPINGEVIIGAVAKGDGTPVTDLKTTKITATNVMLEPITGLPNGQKVEHAIALTDFLLPAAVWQENTMFSGLSPNTEYYVFARSKENENYAAGNPSDGIRFKTAKAELSGTVSISGSPAYGATMTAVIEELYSTTYGVSPDQLGALSYQWWHWHPDSMAASMIPAATNSTYTLTEGDIGKIIRVEVMAANCEGTASGILEEPIDKAMPFGTPTYTAITHANQALTGVVLNADFINPHNNAPVPGAISWDSLPETLVKRGKAYSWTFIPEEGANYHTVHGSIIPWPAATGGGGYNSYIPPAASTKRPDKVLNQPVIALASVTARAGENGSAKVYIPDKIITDIISKAQVDAKAQGKTANGTSVVLNVTMPQGANSLTATLTQTSLSNLIKAGVKSFELSGTPISIGLDLAALKDIHKQSSGGDISIDIVLVTELSAQAKALITNRPVYNIKISTVKDVTNVNITNLGNGTATLSIPYTAGKNQAVGYLFGVYVDGSGKPFRINDSSYDANAGAILMTTRHFSVFGVGYIVPKAKFTDIGAHWSKDSIDYVVGRGLLYGSSKTTFSPDTAMTWEMLVTALGRLAGVDAKAYTIGSFSDVKADSSLQSYIEWAYKKGIIQGISNHQFAPDRAITREEIAVILVNYAKATGYKLPVTREATDYADYSGIGSTYKTAVTAMQQAGIMMGGMNNKFNPKSNATRAEVSSMIHRYIKLTIEPATAQGWSLNDAGQCLYYKDGKALTATQTINGVKYFFNVDGTLKTGWIKDGGNWKFYSGSKMLTGWWDIGSDTSKKTYYFDTSGNIISRKLLKVGNKWYYFHPDGSLAKKTTVEVHDENEASKSK